MKDQEPGKKNPTRCVEIFLRLQFLPVRSAGRILRKQNPWRLIKKCHKVGKVFTINAKAIQKGQIVIDGFPINISPTIPLRKVSSLKAIHGDVHIKNGHDSESPQSKLHFTHSKYGVIKNVWVTGSL